MEKIDKSVKCKGIDCPNKFECIRYRTLTEDSNSKVFAVPPHQNGQCDYFIEFKEDERRRKT